MKAQTEKKESTTKKARMATDIPASITIPDRVETRLGTLNFFDGFALLRPDSGVANRDVLVSGAVFDLDAGPVTITLPDPGQRFMSMLAVDQDHYNPKTRPSCSAEE